MSCSKGNHLGIFMPNSEINTREKLLQLLGLKLPKKNISYDIIETWDDETLLYKRIKYQNCLNESVPGILVMPKDTPLHPRPGMICLPGTSGSAESLVSGGFREVCGESIHVEGWASELARRGWVTLALSIKGCAARTDAKSWLQEAKLLPPTGRTQMGVIVEEVTTGAQLLSGLDEVDQSRVGVMGFSLGGNAAWYALACDSRLAGGVIVCGGLGSLAELIDHGDKDRHSPYVYIPNMLKHFDHPRIVADCIYPRPLFVVGPMKDPDMPASGVDILENFVSKAYEQSAAEENLFIHRPDMVHEFRTETFEQAEAWISNRFNK